MKVTKLRKMESVELTPEQVKAEMDGMGTVKGAKVITTWEPNKYEENLAKGKKLPLRVRTTEILILE